MNSELSLKVQRARIEYIDGMRGFTMILVVFMHLFDLLFHRESFLCEVCRPFRMPLFFFISGFMSYIVYDSDIVKKRVCNRITGQLIPTIIVFILYLLTFVIDYKSFLLDEAKGGYWFTFVMVEVFLVYISLVYLFAFFRFNIKWQTFILVLFVFIPFLFYVFLKDFLSLNAWSNYLCLRRTVIYFPYFIFGVLAKMYKEKFFLMVENSYIIAVVAFLFCISFCVSSHFPRFSKIIFALQGFLGIVIVYSFFHKNRLCFIQPNFISSFLVYIGKYTLAIYLVHYFLIKNLSGIVGYVNMDFILSSWITELLFFIPTLIIVGICLCIEKFFLVSPLLHSLLFGFKINFKKREVSKVSVPN